MLIETVTSVVPLPLLGDAESQVSAATIIQLPFTSPSGVMVSTFEGKGSRSPVLKLSDAGDT